MGRNDFEYRDVVYIGDCVLAFPKCAKMEAIWKVVDDCKSIPSHRPKPCRLQGNSKYLVYFGT